MRPSSLPNPYGQTKPGHSSASHQQILTSGEEAAADRGEARRWGAGWRCTRTGGSRSGTPAARTSSSTSAGPAVASPSSASSASPSPSSSTRASSANSICRTRTPSARTGSSCERRGRRWLTFVPSADLRSVCARTAFIRLSTTLER